MSEFTDLPDEGDPHANPWNLTQAQWEYVDWATTPVDMRESHERTFSAYCESRSHGRETVMGWTKNEHVARAHRELLISKRTVDYQIQNVLDELYMTSLGEGKDKISAARLWLSQMGLRSPKNKTDKVSTGETPQNEIDIDNLSDEEIAQRLAELEA